jgi:hypothetical protein
VVVVAAVAVPVSLVAQVAVADSSNLPQKLFQFNLIASLLAVAVLTKPMVGIHHSEA